MRRHILFISFVLHSIAVAAISIGHAIRDAVAAAFDLFKPEPARLAVQGVAIDLNISGAPLDPALVNLMRHEARRVGLAAPRNI